MLFFLGALQEAVSQQLQLMGAVERILKNNRENSMQPGYSFDYNPYHILWTSASSSILLDGHLNTKHHGCGSHQVTNPKRKTKNWAQRQTVRLVRLTESGY